MSHLVAFEIENEQLLVAVGRTAPRRIKIEHTHSIKLDSDDSALQMGERLRHWLSSHGVHRADAIAVVSRSNAEIRQLTLPVAPDNELPDLVKFKARSDFGSLNDNWSLDFVPFAVEPDKPRQVLAAAISPDLMTQFSTVAEVAGLRLKHIVFRPYAAIDLLNSRLVDEKCRVIVDETGDQIDISLIQGRDLYATRTVRVAADQPVEEKVEQLLREIRLTVTSLASRMVSSTPQEILVCGGDLSEAELLETQFTSRLEIETHFVEPFQLVNTVSGFSRPDKTQSFTALLGALLQDVSDQPHDIDFLNPRRSVSNKQDLKRFYRIGAIVAAALLLMGMLGWWMLSSQAAEIRDLENQLAVQNKKNEGTSQEENVDQILAEIQELDAFKQNSFNWLEEMYEISRVFETPDDAMLDSFDASFKKEDPALVLTGRVKDADTELEIRGNLVKLPYPEVIPNNAGKSGDEDLTEKFFYIIKMPVPGIKQVNLETNRLAIEYLQQIANPDQSTSPDVPGDSEGSIP